MLGCIAEVFIEFCMKRLAKLPVRKFAEQQIQHQQQRHSSALDI